MNWIIIFGIVTLGAIVGMILGGLFGLLAGIIAPGLFSHLVPWADIEPKGAAVIYGSCGGVFCGGGLAVFAIILQYLWEKKGGK